MTNVVYISGFLGSELALVRPDGRFGRKVWPDLQNLALGDFGYLQIAADGVSPGPLAQGQSLGVLGMDRGSYLPLAMQMVGWGWDVLPSPWDWRRGVQGAAAQILAAALARWGNQPFGIVAHSAGGLVARAIWLQMYTAGRDLQLSRIVALGTPNYGLWEPVRSFWRANWAYQAIAGLLIAGGKPTYPISSDYIDQVMASFPGFYEIMPFGTVGPVFQASPATAAAIYTPAFYNSANPYVSAALMASALTTQVQLQGGIPAGRMINVVGTGFQTAYAASGSYPLSTSQGYLYTQFGDNLVTEASATMPGAPSLFVNCDHCNLVLNQTVWGYLPQLVLSGLASDYRVVQNPQVSLPWNYTNMNN